jgi:hypothetical protein
MLEFVYTYECIQEEKGCQQYMSYFPHPFMFSAGIFWILRWMLFNWRCVRALVS